MIVTHRPIRLAPIPTSTSVRVDRCIVYLQRRPDPPKEVPEVGREAPDTNGVVVLHSSLLQSELQEERKKLRRLLVSTVPRHL